MPKPPTLIPRSKSPGLTRRTKLGTDEAFFQLMTLSGSAILKLLGVPATEAAKYRFCATVLKEKKLQPDIQGFPILKSETGRVIIEFHGYEDKFIRYRLVMESIWDCLQDSYDGKVLAAIIFTEKKYQQAALPLQLFDQTQDCTLGGCWTEIVLTDYTEAQLLAIDPKLVVLAPFTVPKNTDKTTLLNHGLRWQTQLTQAFPPRQQPKGLNLLGLIILDRFSKLTYEEVRTMLNLNLNKSVAVRQVREMARAKGHAEGHAEGRTEGRAEGRAEGLAEGQAKGQLEEAQQVILETLQERFRRVPAEVSRQIRHLQQHNVLKTLFRQALRCSSLKSFKEVLAQVKS